MAGDEGNESHEGTAQMPRLQILMGLAICDIERLNHRFIDSSVFDYRNLPCWLWEIQADRHSTPQAFSHMVPATCSRS